MIYLAKKDVDKIVKELSDNQNKRIKEIVKKLKSPEKRRVYVSEKSEIKKLLRKAFDEKRKVKIRYYSFHLDENTTRIIDIYKIYKRAITAFCHLREEERNFVIDRINSATLLDEKYNIPNNWEPEDIILDK